MDYINNKPGNYTFFNSKYKNSKMMTGDIIVSYQTHNCLLESSLGILRNTFSEKYCGQFQSFTRVFVLIESNHNHNTSLKVTNPQLI